MLVTLLTHDGFQAVIEHSGHAFVQAACDKLSQTHFDGNLPPIRCFVAEALLHPGAHFSSNENFVQALTMETKDFVNADQISEPWIIFIDKRFCGMPLVMQFLLHEMVHVLYPNEDPFHSLRFWETVKEKWLKDLDLVMGVGLNADERPSGLSAEMRSALSYCNDRRI